jgi:hypothetical protein
MVKEILEPLPYGFKNARDRKEQGSSISRKTPFALEALKNVQPLISF